MRRRAREPVEEGAVERALELLQRQERAEQLILGLPRLRLVLPSVVKSTT